MGLPCAVRSEKSCIHCCKKHIKYTIDDKQICEQDNCKICKFNKEYEERGGAASISDDILSTIEPRAPKAEPSEIVTPDVEGFQAR